MLLTATNRIVRLADFSNPLSNQIRFVNVACRGYNGSESQCFAQLLAGAYLGQFLLDLGQVVIARSGQWSVMLLRVI